MKWLIALLSAGILAGCVLSGCVSATSSTGASSEAAVKSQQQINQENKQKSTSNDTTNLRIEATNLYITDTQGKTLMHIVIGGGEARTGSQSYQNSNTSLTNEQVNEAIAKSSSEASAKSKASVMPLVIIGIIVLVLLAVFSVGSRLVPAFNGIVSIIKSITKPKV